MDRERAKHYLKHQYIERILPNSFGLSNTVEGESGYCRDHLETREKDAGVLTEDRGRFGWELKDPQPGIWTRTPIAVDVFQFPHQCHRTAPSGLAGHYRCKYGFWVYH